MKPALFLVALLLAPAAPREDVPGSPAKKCVGCSKRDTGTWDDNESWSTGTGSCTLEMRSKYVSYSQTCTQKLTASCVDRTCEFEWKLQVRAIGNCTEEEFTYTPEYPDDDPTSIDPDNQWQSIEVIPKLDRDCGFSARRKGMVEWFTGGPAHRIDWDLTVGCGVCGNKQAE